ncbi:DUF4394 domain-containing protein [Rubrimonas cliftonensis]|uniref:VPLPA-CTERM protein sorting domain-containing protein n=1 Tax=Rubrimonas cliftonensis TaxID=89524 RepID=A0A1H4BZX6_9RHOB|nr:DUF4394 domain-containing protein [Rubrimonas cliftonensis]SEA53698.1 VPLPA-CTERM protein sorting domain-containing protein [Rubrimonas cliftonensis]
MYFVAKAVFAASSSLVLSSAAIAAPIGLALGNNGSTLVTIADISTASGLSGKSIRLADGSAVTLDDIDYRPATGEVFGYNDQDDTVYRVDVSTGVATAVASRPGGTNVPTNGFDFNNVLDAARIVNTQEANLVFRPNATPPDIIGSEAGVMPLRYNDGDANFGRDPSIFANAYTNAFAGPASTRQFVLDSEWDILATLDNNAGTLNTIGSVFSDGMALDFTENGGFDILSAMMGENVGYALLTDAGGVGLYEIALAANAMGQVDAMLLGRFDGQFGVLDGFTVFDAGDVAPVPVPAAAGLLIAGLAGLAALGRRRRAA